MEKEREKKDENYNFSAIDKDRIIDAGPKGNVARFMNHSCSPNCETRKWTVNGVTRVGLFAITDIPRGAELTINYNQECIGEGRDGAHTTDELAKKRKSVPLKHKKKKKSLAQEAKLTEVITCFVCGGPDAIQSCDRKACNKFYHLNCVNLENLQEGKWVCPWHNCNICTKRTTRCCYKCTNSYCPIHSHGNIRYYRVKGFVCTEHDVKEVRSSSESSKMSEEMSSSSFKPSSNESERSITPKKLGRPKRYSKRGRPKKSPRVEVTPEPSCSVDKRPRGRPRKIKKSAKSSKKH